MVLRGGLGASGFILFWLWNFSTADQEGNLLDKWNQDPAKVSNKFQCDNLCKQLKDCRLAVYNSRQRTCFVKYQLPSVTSDTQDLSLVGTGTRSICRDCLEEVCIPVTEARRALCTSRDPSQVPVSSSTKSTSTSAETSTEPSVVTLEVTTFNASSTPGTTAAPPAPPTTSSTAVPTSQSTTFESITTESSPTTLLSISSAASASETTSTPIPTTDTTTSAMPTTTQGPCALDATHFASESVCVKVFTPKLTWQDTKTVCEGESFNGNRYRMITFKTEDKHDEIVAYLTEKLTTAVGIWTGLTYTSGSWQWEDGTEAQYLPWQPTEPNTLTEKCAVIYKPTHWTMHNNFCYVKWSAMCEVSAR
ncbi:integumentary mucin A.1-like [Haliotis cracherodii]|uniref:integumentary mucin A.1-like n=1 Tax=Haliotis cracherodii TaxID=6455 RepID=UPI0039E9A7C4